MTQSQAPAPLMVQVDTIQAHIESIVENGNDQELFISAYVNGHFDLAVVESLKQPTATLEDLDNNMKASLNAASDELAEADFEQALHFWQSCINIA